MDARGLNAAPRFTALTRGMNGPGCRVHHADRMEFLHLYVSEITNLEDDNVVLVGGQLENNRDVDARFRITIGDGVAALNLTKPNDSNCILKNFCIDELQEVWIATSQPNKYCVYGITTLQPI